MGEIPQSEEDVERIVGERARHPVHRTRRRTALACLEHEGDDGIIENVDVLLYHLVSCVIAACRETQLTELVRRLTKHFRPAGFSPKRRASRQRSPATTGSRASSTLRDRFAGLERESTWTTPLFAALCAVAPLHLRHAGPTFGICRCPCTVHVRLTTLTRCD